MPIKIRTHFSLTISVTWIVFGEVDEEEFAKRIVFSLALWKLRGYLIPVSRRLLMFLWCNSILGHNVSVFEDIFWRYITDVYDWTDGWPPSIHGSLDPEASCTLSLSDFHMSTSLNRDWAHAWRKCTGLLFSCVISQHLLQSSRWIHETLVDVSFSALSHASMPAADLAIIIHEICSRRGLITVFITYLRRWGVGYMRFHWLHSIMETWTYWVVVLN